MVIKHGNLKGGGREGLKVRRDGEEKKSKKGWEERMFLSVRLFLFLHICLHAVLYSPPFFL
jgi:hypothetical protein